MVTDNVDSFNNVGMVEGRANAKLGSDLLLVFSLGLADALWPELLDSVDVATGFLATLDEPDSAASTGTKDTTPFAVLFREMNLSCLRKGDNRLLAIGSWSGDVGMDSAGDGCCTFGL